MRRTFPIPLQDPSFLWAAYWRRHSEERTSGPDWLMRCGWIAMRHIYLHRRSIARKDADNIQYVLKCTKIVSR